MRSSRPTRSVYVDSPDLRSLHLAQSRAAVIGCALSHLTLWQHVASTVNQQHLIFEDDANFVEGFVDKWNSEYYYGWPTDSYVSCFVLLDIFGWVALFLLFYYCCFIAVVR